MAKLHSTELRQTREKPSITDPERGEDFFADLRSSFLQATKAEHCVIKLSPGWHHVTLQFKRESDDSTTYEAIVLDGTTYSLNWSFPPTVTPDGWWGLAANYQMDSDFYKTPYPVYLDKFTFSAW